MGRFFYAPNLKNMTANTNTDLRTGVNGDVGCKYPCKVATTANITLEGTQTINGIAVVENDIVLVKDQNDLKENGVYVVSTGQWQRGVWFNNQLNVAQGTLVAVVQGGGSGMASPMTLWMTKSNQNPIEFGVSEITFSFFALATSSGGGVFLISTNNLSDVADASTSRHNLGLEIGVNVQAYNIALAALSSLTPAANKVPMFSGASTATLLTVGTASGNVPLIGTASATESLAGLAEIATQAETNAGSNDTNFITPLKLTTNLAATTFQSAEQTITQAGSLTLAHGLSAQPKKYGIFLICKTAELGYAVGNETIINPGIGIPTDDGGVSIVPDATNLNIRYGNDTNVFAVVNKDTGTVTRITPANWKAIFRASINF